VAGSLREIELEAQNAELPGQAIARATELADPGSTGIGRSRPMSLATDESIANCATLAGS
jgi:hypothetical protein